MLILYRYAATLGLHFIMILLSSYTQCIGDLYIILRLLFHIITLLLILAMVIEIFTHDQNRDHQTVIRKQKHHVEIVI